MSLGRNKSSAYLLCATFLWLISSALFSASWAEEITPKVDASNDFVSTEIVPEEISHVEVAWELDAYYTDVGLNIPLTDKPIPTIRSNKESVILEQLIEGSFTPRFMLIEASIYPMPILGTYLKSNQPQLYQNGQVANTNLNIIESATAGFQEPWAVSLFLGNIAKLVRPGDPRIGSNIGYTGYLFSGGQQHIKNNVLIDDSWFELEWKIKGKLDYANEKLGWSFRAGAKYHQNPGISDVVYVSLFRSSLNAQWPILAWLNNSSFNIKTHFTQDTLKFVRQEIIIGKKVPIWSWNRFTPTVETGLIWSSPDEYRDLLRDSPNAMLTFIFRPSIEF
ncbi:MAG: hypothetical protein RLZZ144_299 [Pseudomonadota bacterium]|jgi:hypothetical protein